VSIWFHLAFMVLILGAVLLAIFVLCVVIVGLVNETERMRVSKMELRPWPKEMDQRLGVPPGYESE